MVMHHVERKMIVLTKYSALAAVLGSLAGALLMFLLGLLSIYDAYEETREALQDRARTSRPMVAGDCRGQSPLPQE